MAQERLNILIGAKDTATGVFRRFQRTLGGVAKGILSFKGALVGVAGIGGIGLLVKNSLEATDRISKLSRTIGLSVQELQGLKFAGEIAGVELETLGKAVRNLSRVTNDFAVRGLTTSKEAFDKLGISAADLNEVGNDQLALFELVGDRISKLENGFEKTAIAQQLFGGRASEVIRVLESGKGSFADLRKEAGSLGLILSKEAAEGVEKANDAITRLRRLFTGITNQMVAALAPALELLATTLTTKVKKAIDESGGSVAAFGRNIAVSFLDGIKKTILGLQILVNQVSLSVSQITRGAVEIGTVDFSGPVKKIFELQELIKKGTAGVGEATADAAEETDKNLQKAKESFNVLRDTLGATEEEVKTISQGIAGDFGESFKSVIKGTASVADAFKSMTSKIIDRLLDVLVIQRLVGTVGGGGAGSGGTGIAGILSGTRAQGGPVTGGQSYLVGEKGAEIFTPSKSGYIIPNNQMGGGVNITQNINVGNGGGNVRAEIMSMLPMIKEASKSAVLEASRRGGSYANSFGN